MNLPDRRAVLHWLAAVPALGMSAACGKRRPPAVDFSDAERAFNASDYDRVRKLWTRHDKLVRDIGTVLEMWVTYKSAEFRQAYLAQYAEVYGLRGEELAELRKSQLEASRTGYEFHVVAQSTEWKWNDLEQKDSVWKIVLADGSGQEIAPVQVSYEKLPALYEMRFFPERTDFSRTYTIRFPREAGGKFSGASTGKLALRVVGPLGVAAVDWDTSGA
ncbi:MAG TPA: hypothetical protein VGG33_27780 [Polyangia bacterium]